MVVGDEYTELLNALRPLRIERETTMGWSSADHMYNVLERVVNDARRYRMRAEIAEADVVALNAQLDTVTESIAIGINALCESVGIRIEISD